MYDDDVRLDPSAAAERPDHHDNWIVGTARGIFNEAVGSIPIVEPADPAKSSLFEPGPALDPGAAPSGGAGGAEGSGGATNAAGSPPADTHEPPAAAHRLTGAGYHRETGELSDTAGNPRSPFEDVTDAVNAVNPIYAIALGAYKIDRGIETNDPEGVGAGIVDIGLGSHGVSSIAHGTSSEGTRAALDDAATTPAKPNVSVQELAEPRIRDAHLPGSDLTASKSQGVDAISGTGKMVENWRQDLHDGKPLVVHEVDGGVWGQIKCMEKADLGNFKRNVETAMEKFDDRLKSPEGPRTRDAEGNTYLQEVFKNPEGFRLVVEVPKLTNEQKVQMQAIADEKAAGYSPLLGAPVSIVVVDAHTPVEHTFEQSAMVVPAVDHSLPPIVPVGSGVDDRDASVPAAAPSPASSGDGFPAVEHSFVQSPTNGNGDSGAP
jgi:hypothetical protein